MSELTRDPYVAAFPENLPFWEAAARGELLLPRCQQCGETHWHPRAHCPFCRSDALGWERASGRGRLHTFTLVRRPDSVTLLAYVRLDEGPLMMTNLVDTPHEELRLDMTVEVLFRPTPEGRSAPVFRSVRNQEPA
jgi:uncharacterized OB-fold protein